MTARPDCLVALVDGDGHTLGYLRLIPAPPAAAPAKARVRGLEVDVEGRRASVWGRPVDLTRIELGLLVTLASDPSRAFTRDELLREVWGYAARGRTRTVDLHASRLRRKLGAGFVTAVYGVGYRLVDPARLEHVA